MKKILKITAILIASILIIGILFINFSLPALPTNTNTVIKEVINGELMQLKGEEGFVYNDSVKIWYENILPKDSVRGTVLLIMGISNDALSWPDYFMQPFLEEGYQIVRFDNRGVGMSDWIEDWTEETTYSLTDMAKDGVVVLDHLGIDTVHVIGVSLGGMIAQTMSIHFSERVSTLTSMMSTGYMMDGSLPGINKGLIVKLLFAQAKYGLFKSEKNEIKLNLMARELLKGSQNYELDTKGIAESVIYNLRKRNGENPVAFKQQSAAVMKSGSRYEALKQLAIPTLVMHGTADPLIPFDHGKKCYELIPNAKKLWIEGMGHDIPKFFNEKVVTGILEHIKNY